MDPTTLTASKVDALKVAADEWHYGRGRCPASVRRLSPSGKAWFIRLSVERGGAGIGPGRFPAMSRVDARAALRANCWAKVAAGADPAEAKTDAKHEATLQNLRRRVACNATRSPNKRTAWQDRKVLGRYLPSTWYTRPACPRLPATKLWSCTPGSAATTDITPPTACWHWPRTMLNGARLEFRFKGDNPAIRIKLFKEEKRERFLSPEEVRRLNDALLDEPNPYWKAYFPLALMLGTRRRGTAFGPLGECRLGSPHATTARDQGRSVSSTAPTRTSYRATTIASQPRAGRICVPGPRCLRPLG